MSLVLGPVAVACAGWVGFGLALDRLHDLIGHLVQEGPAMLGGSYGVGLFLTMHALALFDTRPHPPHALKLSGILAGLMGVAGWGLGSLLRTSV